MVEGDNTFVVYVADDIHSGKQCSGKQSAQRFSYGCYYTRTTGIWQSVWLEYVPHSYIKALRMTPDALNSNVEISAELVGSAGAILTLMVKEKRCPSSAEKAPLHRHLCAM